MRAEYADGVIAVAGTGITVVLFAAGVAVFVAIGSRMTFQAQAARIEQLRTDAAAVDPSQAEDVIGQVTEANKFLAGKRVCNSQWWCDWAIPDGWDRVAMIPVPKVAR